MSSYKSSARLKASAKEHMFGHYGTAVGACLLVAFTTDFFALTAPGVFGNRNTALGTCIYYIVSYFVSVATGLFSSGVAYFYLKITCGQRVTVSDVFQGFRFCPDKALKMQAFLSLVSYAAGIVPGLLLSSQALSLQQDESLVFFLLSMAFSAIVALAFNLLYGQAFFLLHDFPQYSAKELLATSRKLMSGHKARLFYIYISFFPLMLLSLPSCGIAMLWVRPYMNATLTEFYLDIVTGSSPVSER